MVNNNTPFNTAILRTCKISGVDVKEYVTEVYVCATVFTPYMVCEISIVDTANIQDIVYQSGGRVELSYSSGYANIVRDYRFITIGNYERSRGNNGQYSKGKIIAVSDSYFNRQNERVGYFHNISPSDAFKKLHDEYDPKNPVKVTPARGMIGDIEPYHDRGMKLCDSLDRLRSRLSDEKYQSALYLYFQKQDASYICAPFEGLINQSAKTTFTQKLAFGLSYAEIDNVMSHNIIASKAGDADNLYGSDSAQDYQSALQQKGGDANTGWDWASMTYKRPDSKSFNVNSVDLPGKTKWVGPTSDKPNTLNQKFNVDRNQKSGEDFESNEAKKKYLKALMLQGSMLINVPLEGGLYCQVGDVCNLKLNSEGAYNTSTVSGNHLILAQGEYIFPRNPQMQGMVAFELSSGGKQGDFS